MKFRSLIFVLTIAFSVIFVSMLGTSYAYYIATDGTQINVTTSNIDLGIAIVFEESQYINLNTGIPINETDVNTLASISQFTINPDSSVLVDTEVSINIGLVDIYIDDALVVRDFRYKITCNDGTNDVMNENGTGNAFAQDVINSGYFKFGTLSTTLDTFDVSKDYTCTLRMWLQESGGDQNSLMNKKFRGLIKVDTLFKK